MRTSKWIRKIGAAVLCTTLVTSQLTIPTVALADVGSRIGHIGGGGTPSNAVKATPSDADGASNHASPSNADKSKGTITEIYELPTKIASQMVSLETELSHLNLPETLKVSVYVAEDGETGDGTILIEDIDVDSWESTPAYTGEKGTYWFYPQLDSAYGIESGVELPEILITVSEKAQQSITAFSALEESVSSQRLSLGAKESDITFPNTLQVTVRTAESEEITPEGITWKLDTQNSAHEAFQGGISQEEYFTEFDADQNPIETKEKTWSGYHEANADAMGAYYTYVAVLPETDSDGNTLVLAEGVTLPEITVLVGESGIMLMALGDELTNGKCGDNLTYRITQNNEDDENPTYTLTISGTGAMYDYDVDGQPWKDYRSKLTELVLEGSITSIGSNAFNFCGEFTGDLTIPNSVKSIGNNAFQGCAMFNGTLTIPNGVESIGEGAFGGCRAFTGDLIIPNSVKSIGNNAFIMCIGFNGTLTISNGVESIGNSAFNSCSGFTGDLTIPDSVISIGDSAFYSCSSFTGDLIIPDSVTSIGESAFNACSGLRGVLTIPGSVTSIGNSAFMYCDTLTAINNYSSVSLISDNHYSFYITYNVCRTITYELGTGAAWKEPLGDYTDDRLYYIAGTGRTSLPTAGTLTLSEDSAAFAGWYSKDGTTTGDWGTLVTSIGSGETENKTFYAKYRFYPKLQQAEGKSLNQEYTGNPVDHSDCFQKASDGAVTQTYYLDADGNHQTGTGSDSASGATSEGGAPVNVGTYYVKASVPETDTHVAGETAVLLFSIGKGTAVVSALTVDGWTYGDAANAPVATSNSDVTPEYTYKVKTADDSTYTETVPADAGTYTVKVTYPANENYTEATKTADFTIAKKQITPSITGTAEKVYDGMNTVENGDLSIALEGVLSGDTSAVSATAVYTYDSADAGTNINITASNLTLEGARKDNYTLSATSPTTTGTITAKPLADGMFENVPTQYYTGNEIEPAVSTTSEGTGLVLGTDYTVSYANHTDIHAGSGSGAPTVTIMGIRNYQGSLTRTFAIQYYDGTVSPTMNNESYSPEKWYNANVTIAAEGYTISDSIAGTFAPTYTYVVTAEGSDSITLYFRQNDSSYTTDGKSYTIKVDKTAPTGSIQVKTSAWDSFQQTVSLGFNTAIEDTITITSTDTGGSGIAKTEYCILPVQYTDLSALNAASPNWIAYSGTPKIEKNTKNYIYARMTDHAGNTRVISTQEILHDDVKPVVTGITPNLTDRGGILTVTATEEGSGISDYYLLLSEDAGTITSADAAAVKAANHSESYFTLTNLTPNTSYHYAILAVDKAGNESELYKGDTPFTTPKQAITGTVMLTGANTYGGALTADVSGLPQDAGTCSYQWYRGDGNELIAGATAQTYTLTEADINQKITVKVTAANCSGELSVTATEAVKKAACPTENVPAEGTVNDTQGMDTFTFNGKAGVTYEYSLDGGTTWQDITLAGTQGSVSIGNYAYGVGKVQVRAKETTTCLASSSISNETAFTAVLEGSASLSGTAKYAETLTASVAGTQNGASLTYKFTHSGSSTALQTGSSSTYTIREADIGKNIMATVTAAGYTGELTSTMAETVEKADGRVIPGNVTGTKTDDGQTYTYTVNAIPGAEYRMDEGTYQTSHVFTGITPGTSHTFYAVMPETTGYKGGNPKDTGAEAFPKLTPAAPTLSYTIDRTNPSDVSVTIAPVAGAEYSFDGGNTYSSAADANVKAGYTLADTADFAIRLTETATHHASPAATASVRLAKPDATLSGLSVTDVDISPSFNSAITEYTASVGNSVSSIVINAEANDSNAAVSGDTGVKALNVGSNTFTITVTAENNVTKIYTIVITRAAQGGSSSGSSSGGSSGGGGSSTSTTTAAQGTTTTDAKKGTINSVTGIVTGSGSGHSSWQQETTADGTTTWKLQYADGTYAAGTVVTLENGTTQEHPAWELINGAWYLFGADGNAKSGFVFDPTLNGTFYIDINTGMKTGWVQIDGKWYYFNPGSDGTRGMMFAGRESLDGYYLKEDGSWDEGAKKQ